MKTARLILEIFLYIGGGILILGYNHFGLSIDYGFSGLLSWVVALMIGKEDKE